jgi:hypothetical protein
MAVTTGGQHKLSVYIHSVNKCSSPNWESSNCLVLLTHSYILLIISPALFPFKVILQFHFNSVWIFWGKALFSFQMSLSLCSSLEDYERFFERKKNIQIYHVTIWHVPINQSLSFHYLRMNKWNNISLKLKNRLPFSEAVLFS